MSYTIQFLMKSCFYVIRDIGPKLHESFFSESCILVSNSFLEVFCDKKADFRTFSPWCLARTRGGARDTPSRRTMHAARAWGWATSIPEVLVTWDRSEPSFWSFLWHYVTKNSWLGSTPLRAPAEAPGTLQSPRYEHYAYPWSVTSISRVFGCMGHPILGFLWHLRFFVTCHKKLPLDSMSLQFSAKNLSWSFGPMSLVT